ncbi:MAG: ABC transporter permease subunit [Clostridiales bacterium]|nr:ABC transporter permease subunit [Clostridiales bacterium]
MESAQAANRSTAAPARLKLRRAIGRYWMLYVLLAPLLLYYVIFCYLPMFGIVIAFQDYRATRGVFGSEWVGFKHFAAFFSSEYLWRTVRNTLSISGLGLVFGFPAPILLALMLNELRGGAFKKTVQTITYIPHFISVVVIVSIVMNFVSTKGLINELLALLGAEPIRYASDPSLFYPVYVISGIWQTIGWDSIIFLAALAGVAPELYEAATIDGAKRLRRIWHVTLPGIAPTIALMLILRMGGIMSVGYEKIILMYNPGIYEKADVISTYVFRRGLSDGQYSFAAAVGLFNSVVNFILLLAADRASKRLGQSGLL